MARRQLHHTAIDTLSRCGEQFRRRYIEGEIIAPGIFLLVGRATHCSVALNMGHKLETGDMLPAEACAEAARDTLNAEWGKGIVLTDEEGQQDITMVRGEAVDKAVRLAVLHHDCKAPDLHPTHIERQWTIELPGYDLDLAGTIDIQEGMDAIRDTKTSGKSPSKDVAENSDQLTVYALAARVIDGAVPARLALDYLVDLKRGPKVQTLETTRTADDFQVYLRRVEAVIRALDKGAFVPARQTDWWCSERWCGYAPTCPYFRGRKTIAFSGAADANE